MNLTPLRAVATLRIHTTTADASNPRPCSGWSIVPTRRANRANAGASAALEALVRVDHVLVVALADRADGTLGFAGTAFDAFVGNFVSHFNTSVKW